jgi:acetyl/propionyl-CoA carboxylase alpha subunit
MVHEVRWPDGRTAQVDAGDLARAQWHTVAPGIFDVRVGLRNHRVERLSVPDAWGRCVLRIDGMRMEVQVADHRMLLLERMGMSTASAGVDRELTAPMPGKVLSVTVHAGDAVAEGDAVAVLEAMKMENLIRSPRAGVVASVSVQPGAAVEKGAVLLTYEDA